MGSGIFRIPTAWWDPNLFHSPDVLNPRGIFHEHFWIISSYIQWPDLFASTNINIFIWATLHRWKRLWLSLCGANIFHTFLVCHWSPWKNSLVGLVSQSQHWKQAVGQDQRTLDLEVGLLIKPWGQKGQVQKGGWQDTTCHQNPWSESM